MSFAYWGKSPEGHTDSSNVWVTLPRRMAERYVEEAEKWLAQLKATPIIARRVEDEAIEDQLKYFVAEFKLVLAVVGRMDPAFREMQPADPIKVALERDRVECEYEELSESMRTLAVDAGGVSPEEFAEGYLLHAAFGRALGQSTHVEFGLPFVLAQWFRDWLKIHADLVADRIRSDSDRDDSDPDQNELQNLHSILAAFRYAMGDSPPAS